MAEKASAGMTEKAGTGMTERASAGMTEKASVGMTEKADAGMTEKASAGMTVQGAPLRRSARWISRLVSRSAMTWRFSCCRLPRPMPISSFATPRLR